MEPSILNSPWLRPSVFIIFFAIFCLLEVITPRRRLTSSKKKRWMSNLSLSLFNSLILKYFMPFTLVIFALKAQSLNIGLFNIIDVPHILEIGLSLVILDFFIYLQHIASHKFSFLWKLHRVHHADVDLDVSSGNRFHTLEIVLSFFYKSALIFIIGPSAASIILFEIILNTMAMFNHSNINIPMKIDKILRLFVVTPDMHRVHHSIERSEYNTNFGFNLSIWDFLFKTYKNAPLLGQQGMEIGLKYFREEKYISPLALLKMPFLKGRDDS